MATTTPHEAAPSGPATSIATVSTDELAGLLNRCEPLSLINVLPTASVAKMSGERIPGSHWIPLDELAGKAPLLFSRDEPIVVYCGAPT